MIKNLDVNLEAKLKVDRSLVKQVVSLLKKDLHFEISSLIINFVSAAKITEINTAFLNHNYSTDIITFNYSDNIGEIDAEIFISVDNAQQNALKYKVLFIEEIIRLIIHGTLHVSGYDDKKPGKKVKMKQMENKLLNSYKIILLGKKG